MQQPIFAAVQPYSDILYFFMLPPPAGNVCPASALTLLSLWYHNHLPWYFYSGLVCSWDISYSRFCIKSWLCLIASFYNRCIWLSISPIDWQVDKHSSFQETRCLYVVSTDDFKADFSYRKCMENFVKTKHPEVAEAFIRKYFIKRRADAVGESTQQL